LRSLPQIENLVPKLWLRHWNFDSRGHQCFAELAEGRASTDRGEERKRAANHAGMGLSAQKTDSAARVFPIAQAGNY
jgi:hypothetical protein